MPRKRRHLGNQPSALQASAESDQKSITLEGVAEFADLEAKAGEPTKQPTVEIVAYTGGPLRVDAFFRPIVVDLAGLRGSNTTAILLNHDRSQVVGQATKTTIGKTDVRVSARITGNIEREGSPANEVVAHARNGFKWPVSIGASVDKLESIGEETKVKVNGKEFSGPLLIARSARLGEVSFVAVGADEGASAKIAAERGGKGVVMEKQFAEWLTASGIDPETISEAQQKKLMVAFEAEQKKPETPPVEPEIKAAGTAVDDPVKAMRDAVAQESQRLAKINSLFGDKHAEIKAKALSEGTSFEVAENQFLKAENKRIIDERPTLAIHSHSKPDGEAIGEVVEAALCMTAGLREPEKHFKTEVLEAANKHYRRLGIQQLLLMAAAESGHHVGVGQRIDSGNLRGILRACFPPIEASTPSTFSLPGILGAVANKELLQGFMEVDNSWREIATVKSVSNFHTHTAYRLLDNFEFELLGPAGEIKHGKVSSESYTRQATTRAKMFGLTRQDIINDDMGAFDDVRTRLGRGAAKSFNNVFWTNFLADHATFFTSARTNYITGSTTNLGTDGVGLELGIKAYRQMKSPAADGTKRIGIQPGRPTILLVPPELEFIADRLYKSANVIGGVTNATTPDSNIHAAKYRPVVQDRLSDSGFTGYSTTAWYLFGDVMKPMVVSFLNGVETPTVESAEADFNTLGIQLRGYHDFGCDPAEYLAGVKSKGAA